MSVRQIAAGTTDVSVTLRIIDATDGTPETSVTFETTGIDLWYRRDGAAATDITEATQTVSGAHTDGGFVHIADGWYRLDLPDAACATSAAGVQIGGTVTGMVVLAPYIELTTGVNVTQWNGSEITTELETSADIADAVCDEALSGHTTAGTLGKAVSDILTDTGTTLGGKLDTIDGNVDSILTDTGTTLPASIAALPTATENADALLDRDMSTGTDSGSATVRTPRQALRALRNKVSIASGTATITKEDDSTASWTAAVTTASGDPISAIDPASS